MTKLTIIEPKVELFEQTSDEQFHVARCARVCYGRETGNDEATYNRLLRDKHWSMFRHWSVYAKVPTSKTNNCLDTFIERMKHCPYVSYRITRDYLYISTNKNFLLDIEIKDPLIYAIIADNVIDYIEAVNIEEMLPIIRYTFIIDTSIAVSRELNRVSPNNIAERSTRYVLENGSICRPFWLNDCSIIQPEPFGGIHVYASDGKRWDVAEEYLTQTRIDFDVYKYMISRGMPREAARGKLPLDTATRCVYTYTIEEWRNIIDLRYYGATGKPHPDAKRIAELIRRELIKQGYEFREV